MQRFSTGLLSFVLITIFTFSNANDDNKSISDKRSNIAEITGRSIPNYVDCSTKLGAWYSDKNDCRKFYICVMGNAIEQECQADEFFDDERKSCRPGDCPTLRSKPAKKDNAKLSGKVNMPPSKLYSDVEECEDGTIVPNEYDTKKFYVCYDGALRSQNCPDRMRFSDKQGFCIAQNSGMNCGSVPHGGFGPAQTSNAFYVCNNGEMVLQLCPRGQQFNPMLGYCTRFKPIPPPIRPPPPPPPPPPSMTCGGYPQGSFIADVVDENKYWICMFGELRPQYCPTGMVFNNQTLYCVATPTTKPAGTCGPYLPGVRIPDCNNCTQYLICTMGVFLIQSCPSGTSFVNATQNCTGTCPGGPGGGGGGGGGGVGTPCTSSNAGQIQPITGQLQTYDQCLNGQWTKSSCSPNLIFSPTSLMCYEPCSTLALGNDGKYAANPINPNSYIDCTSPSSPITPKTCAQGSFSMALNNLNPPCIQPALPACPPGNTYANIPYFPNGYTSSVPGYSEYYVSCNNNAQTLQRCPAGFILYGGSCYKLNARNARNILIESLDDQQTLCSSSNAGQIQPITGQLQTYSQCSNGQWTTRSCSPNQIFSPTLLICYDPCSTLALGDGGLYAANPINPNSYIDCTSPSSPITPKTCAQGTFSMALNNLNPPCIQPALPAYVNIPYFPNGYISPVPGYSQYYVGYNNDAPTLQRCPAGFVIYGGSCYKVGSERNARNILIEGFDDQQTDLCHNKKHGTYIPIEGDCQRFYVCLDSVPIEHACPRGQYFEPVKHLCVANDRGQCNGNYIRDINKLKTESSTKAPESATDCFGKHGIFIADPNDCHRYFTCVNGWKIGQTCNYGERYDRQTQSCVFDYDNTCTVFNFHQLFTVSNQIEASFENEYESQAVSCTGRDQGEHFENKEDCTGYYVCSKGVAVPKQCPIEHYFDPIKRVCRPNDGSCSSQSEKENHQPLDMPLYLAASDNTSVCIGKHGIIVPDQKDCKSFYLCIYGRAHHDRCYDGEYFDSRQRHCIKNQGQCESATVETEKQPSSEEKQSSNICNGYFDRTHLPNPDNCNHFYVCIDGVPVLGKCGENEFFDSIHGFCRQNQNGSDSCSNVPSEENVCNGKHGIHVEHPDDCRKYFLCVNSQPLVHDCKINEYFNMRTGSCILDIDGKCSGIKEQSEDTNAEILTQENTGDIAKEENTNKAPLKPAVNPFAASQQIEEKNSEGSKTSIPVCTPGIMESMFYPNVDDGCRTFYECVDGRPIIHSCPIGFLYNAILNICDVPDFVECTHTMNIKETRDPSCEGAVSGVRYANFENDCQSFYVCSHGSAVQTFCGEGLRYNPIMGVCDWSSNVHCGTSNGVVISNS